MKILFILSAFVFGALAPTQAGVNMRLKDALGDPVLAALISFAVGTISLLIYCMATKVAIPDASKAFSGPWWMWTGGFMGAFFVASAVIIAPVLGAANMMAWMIAGQLTASLLLDHFGLIGYAVREISPMRIVGALMVVTGALLIKKF